MAQLVEFFNNNGAMVFGILFAISEALSFIPAVKSNGIFQMIYNFLKEKVGKK